jgi:hypothetical protein
MSEKTNYKKKKKKKKDNRYRDLRELYAVASFGTSVILPPKKKNKLKSEKRCVGRRGREEGRKVKYQRVI